MACSFPVEGDDLWLAFGTPRAWLKDGQNLSVKEAPTRHGPLTYHLTSHAEKREIKATIEPLSAPGDRYPKQVKLRISVPDSLGNLKSVTVNGSEWRSFHDDLILLEGPVLKQRLEIVAKY